ncbi:MAG: dephospho-CoA kinase [Eubacteriales bacterium]|nr:dephospho-CoA kinase [Eubacteriales bacterium]
MFLIGITGGIGCGKSTVARLCRDAGLAVIDADEISREVTLPGGTAIAPIIEKFGKTMVNTEGGLDRSKMAKLAFGDRKVLDQLSQIIHREVITEMKRRIDGHVQKKTKALVLDVPIPVKQGFRDTVDQVWVVWADENVRIDRLRGRGVTEEEARRRMAMQMTKDEYEEIADRMIDNNQDYVQLVDQVEALLKQELGNRGIRFESLQKTDVLAEKIVSAEEDKADVMTDE